jgi:hypothetical protein
MTIFELINLNKIFMIHMRHGCMCGMAGMRQWEAAKFNR